MLHDLLQPLLAEDMDPIISDAENDDLNEDDDAVYLDNNPDISQGFKKAFRDAREV